MEINMLEVKKKIKLPKGWKFDRHSNQYRLEITTPRVHPGGVSITINYSRLGNDYTVNTTGHILYIETKEFKTFNAAYNYVKKIMKYVDYGRFTLGITKESFR